VNGADALVRGADPDRWLASRFAPASVRVRLVAGFALNAEIARVSQAARSPGTAPLRYAFWRDAIAEIHAGKPSRAQPTLQAYAACAPPPALAPLWQTLIEARAGEDHAGAETALIAIGLTLCEEEPSRPPWQEIAARGGACAAALAARNLDAARAAHQAVRAAARGFPAGGYPANAALALAPLYLRWRTPPLMLKQLALVWAAARGAL
jgi:phytoene/squalene synthetase